MTRAVCLLQVFLAIIISWSLCSALTAGGVLPTDPELPGYGIRTDTKLHVLRDAQWFRFPYPGQRHAPGQGQGHLHKQHKLGSHINVNLAHLIRMNLMRWFTICELVELNQR